MREVLAGYMCDGGVKVGPGETLILTEYGDIFISNETSLGLELSLQQSVQMDCLREEVLMGEVFESFKDEVIFPIVWGILCWWRSCWCDHTWAPWEGGYVSVSSGGLDAQSYERYMEIRYCLKCEATEMSRGGKVQRPNIVVQKEDADVTR